MKLSKDTLNLLKNFASINGSLYLKEGTTLSTVSEGKNVMVSAEIPESFPVDFGIYDLNEFLRVVAIFPDAGLEFNDKSVIISDGTNVITYFGAGEGIVKPAPSTVKWPGTDVSCSLVQQQFDTIRETSSALKASSVSFIGSKGKLKIVVGDKKNKTANAYDVVIGESPIDFQANFKVENFKMIPGDYDVEISSKKIARFTNKKIDYTMFVAIEADSTF